MSYIIREIEKKDNKAVESVMEFSCSFPTMESKKQKEILGAMVSAIEIFPTKKDTGYLKKISFHIPIFPDEKGNCLTIWDMWPGLLDEDGNSLPIPHDDYEKELIQSIMPSDTDESSNLSDLKGNTDESVALLTRSGDVHP